MKLCRFQKGGRIEFGFYLDDQAVVPLLGVGHAIGIDEVPAECLIDLLPGGNLADLANRLFAGLTSTIIDEHALPLSEVKLLTPLEAPGKLLLLAGNYADHIREGGGEPEDRSKTFPYVFMKPLTTLTHPGDPIRIPAVSPHQIDWELELAVVIGRTARGLTSENALDAVAGYTVVNDVSDRHFRPNPERAPRPRDVFFDWLHGKWHDTFCPMGPCLLSSSDCPDPQTLKMKLSVNGQVEQDGTTADMVFPVRDILSFLTSFVTLHPGDVICTGTPAGVGKAKGRFLKAGDLVEAQIDAIGTLRNPVVGP